MPHLRRDRRLGAIVLSVIPLFLLTACTSEAEPVASPSGGTTTVLGMETVVDVPFTTFEGASVDMDVYLPEDTDAPRGAVLLLHGGAFVSGDRATGGMQRIAEHLVDEGYVAASMSYTLAPTATYPTQVDQTLEAVQFLRENAEEWNIDPDRIAVFGASAGATIALQAAVQPQESTDITAVVSLSAATVLDANAVQGGDPDSDQVRAVLAYLGCADIASCDVGTEASPAFNATAESSPAFIVNGTGEMIPEQHAEAMAAALESAGVEVTLDIVPVADHAADLLSSEVWSGIDDFLSVHLAASP